MGEVRYGGEAPELIYSAAQKKIERFNGIIKKLDATVELLRIDEEALEKFVEESIDFVEIARIVGAENVAKERKDQAMVDVDALVDVRKKIALFKAERARIEESIARFDKADAEYSAMIKPHDASKPLN